MSHVLRVFAPHWLFMMPHPTQLEANSNAMQTAVHTETGNVGFGSGVCDRNGCFARVGGPQAPSWAQQLYGPGKRLDTMKPFDVSAETDSAGALTITLAQGATRFHSFDRQMAGNPMGAGVPESALQAIKASMGKLAPGGEPLELGRPLVARRRGMQPVRALKGELRHRQLAHQLPEPASTTGAAATVSTALAAAAKATKPAPTADADATTSFALATSCATSPFASAPKTAASPASAAPTRPTATWDAATAAGNAATEAASQLRPDGPLGRWDRRTLCSRHHVLPSKAHGQVRGGWDAGASPRSGGDRSLLPSRGTHKHHGHGECGSGSLSHDIKHEPRT